MSYLLSRVVNGLCLEFYQLRHGPSDAWTTACVGSALAEFDIVLPEMLEAILALRWDCGGWSYNQQALPDADTTLRVLQYFRKVGFNDRAIIDAAERFVILHQQTNGGIATFLPEMLAKMRYPEGAWTTSHPCVTALANNVLKKNEARAKTSHYIAERIKLGDARSYWWKTHWYFLYEAGFIIYGESVGDDPVEMGLALLLKAKLRMGDNELMEKLVRLQLEDGSFPSSHQFRIPRPNQYLDDIDDDVEVIEDCTRIFATAASILAVSRSR